ncbi:MAG: hypothetical protein WAZ94_04290 [Phycisphaerales bacterium]
MLHLILSASLCLAAPDPDAARLGIESQLRVMEQAMVKADAPGYLAAVSGADSEFLHEQRYFANDFAKKPPAEVTISLGELKETDGAATAKVTWAWTMPGAKAREVAFDARFIEVDGKWLYAGEVWERHDAPGVMVLFDPGLEEVATNTVEAFTAVRAKVEESFGLGKSALPARTQKIKLYGSMKHLQHSICLSYTDGLGGWNEPKESVKILAGRSSRVNQLKGLLSHEYGHVATFELGPKSNVMPWWVLEGVAELSSEVVVHGRRPRATVERWARAGRIAPWDSLADFENCEDKWKGHVYTQGHHMIGYISDTFGREKLNAWMTEMSRGATIDGASVTALGRPFAQLAAEWRAALPEEGAEEPAPAEEPKKEEPKKEPAAKEEPAGAPK